MRKRETVLLTQRSKSAIIRAAKGASDFMLWDKRTQGFGLRLRKGTALTWIYQYGIGGQDYRMTLAGSMSCEEARTKAEEYRVRVQGARNGDTNVIHPARAREQQRAIAAQPKALTFGAHVQTYLEARKSVVKQNTFEEITRYLTKSFAELSTLTLDKIDLQTVAVELNAIEKASGAASANRARSAIFGFYRWAIGEAGLCTDNPVRETLKRKGENKARDRALTNEEIATVWLNAPNSDYGNIVKLILLTGCRREEIGSLRWDEIDTDARTITIPADRSKNGKPHVIPLSDLAFEILRGIGRRGDHVFGRKATGFSGWSRGKKDLDKIVKLEPWTVHDLRRSTATGMAEIGVQPHIVEACLNHISGHKSGVAGTYNRAQYFEEKKEAFSKWAHHLKTIVALASGANVTPLRKGERKK
jgi:integrase